jgi:hypothetical protein
MLKCICCKDHIHIVLGEGDIQNREPTCFGWPLFSQDVVSIAQNDVMTQFLETEQKKVEGKEFFKNVFLRAQLQKREKNGRFGKLYLPKTREGVGDIDYVSLIRSWIKFVEGNSPRCEYVGCVPIFSYIIFPLRDCSLLNYLTPLPNNASYQGGVWKAKFEIQDGLEVI